eukprot:1156206-Pelagomonas_calceolata.AAC.8
MQRPREACTGFEGLFSLSLFPGMGRLSAIDGHPTRIGIRNNAPKLTELHRTFGAQHFRGSGVRGLMPPSRNGRLPGNYWWRQRVSVVHVAVAAIAPTQGSSGSSGPYPMQAQVLRVAVSAIAPALCKLSVAVLDNALPCVKHAKHGMQTTKITQQSHLNESGAGILVWLDVPYQSWMISTGAACRQQQQQQQAASTGN